ncbi:CinA family protein [Treponema sp.]|uniref:CinA family protein n=1 Tax=Treponema sp. TaxID=166 RepID=UPI00298DDC50|nr:CinA family protein [Treponema sp.]MCQ2241503.1 CinA family protein [Treponema sp.]
MTIAETVTKKLIEKNLTITFMESCTSGLLASMFTDTSGASAVFKGSLVTYSNEMKIAAGVPSETIERFGVYSSECARAMAETVKKIYSADIAVAITGTTGNVDPANEDSVQGRAYYCIACAGKNYDFFIEENVSALSRKEIKQLYADRVYESLCQIVMHI